jgi:hypothetical protein
MGVAWRQLGINRKKMGTTLTGTTPQDTYDSLIKVTDNGPLSGTAKYLSDGLGNDSALALSTAAVGVGTNTPSANLEVSRSTQQTDLAEASQVVALLNTSTDVLNNATGIRFRQVNGTNNCNAFIGTLSSGSSANRSSLVFAPSNSGGDAAEVMRITSAGNVGIGTSSPAATLSISNGGAEGIELAPNHTTSTNRILHYNRGSGVYLNSRIDALTHQFLVSGTEVSRFTANGLTFNGDTAAANALDDYEEGTWTMGVSFGNASVGVTYGVNTGTYTKIGRQVTVNGLLSLTSKGSSTGNAKITGLPFTIAGGTSNYGTPSLRFENVTFTNQFQGYGGVTTTNIELEEITLLGVASTLTNADFANNSTVMINFTYFV